MNLFFRLAVVFLVSTAMTDVRADDAAPEAARLMLRNGDFYSGEFVAGAPENFLRWKSPVAIAPFDFGPRHVGIVHFPQGNANSPASHDLRVEMAGGDLLYGELLGLDANYLTLATTRFGVVEIAKNHVTRISRHNASTGVDFVGPNGLEGWELVEVPTTTTTTEAPDRLRKRLPNQKPPAPPEAWPTPPWREEAGQLVSDRPGPPLTRACSVPAQSEIELCVGWQDKPNFRLTIYVGGEAEDGVLPIHLQVWESDLVIVAEGHDRADLALIKDLQDSAGRLHVVLFVDRPAGIAELHSLEGLSLARIDLPATGIKPEKKKEAAAMRRGGVQVSSTTARRINRSDPGVTVQNAGGDFRFERLIIRRWDGRLPAQGEASLSRIARVDGTRVDGESITYNASETEFVITNNENEERVPLDSVSSLIFPSTTSVALPTYRVSLTDGTRLSGELTSPQAKEVVVSRREIVQDLRIPMGQVSSLVTLVPPASQQTDFTTTAGKLVADGVRSMGQLVDAAGGTEHSCLVWQPWGSNTPQPLSLNLSGKIVYREPLPPVEVKVREQQQPQVEQQQGLLNLFFFGGRGNTTGRTKEFNDLDATMYLASGERFPCTIKSITETEVFFESNITSVTAVPRDQVVMWERGPETQLDKLDPEKRRRMLTVPRMHRNNPPTHLLESIDGDFLRGRLLDANEETVVVEVRLEAKEIPFDTIKRIVWLEEVDAESETEGSEPQGPADFASDAGNFDSQVMAVFRDSLRLTFTPLAAQDNVLSGRSELLGECQVPLTEIDVLYLGAEIAGQQRSGNLAVWKLAAASDPKFMNEDETEGAGGGGLDSPLVGQPAPDFKLETLAGDTFELQAVRGKVVVLDFFATWCGPCVQAMPQVDAVVEEFSDRGVKLVAVNMQEDSERIAGLLERLKIAPTVALDIDGATAEKYNVTAIPQTVIIDREGKVARLFVGGGPSFAVELRKALEAVTAEVGEE